SRAGIASVHDQPASTVHDAEQPSPLLLLPSSHSSVPSGDELPQLFSQVDGTGVTPAGYAPVVRFTKSTKMFVKSPDPSPPPRVVPVHFIVWLAPLLYGPPGAVVRSTL